MVGFYARLVSRRLESIRGGASVAAAVTKSPPSTAPGIRGCISWCALSSLFRGPTELADGLALKELARPSRLGKIRP
jgi:hypothetical protein